MCILYILIIIILLNAIIILSRFNAYTSHLKIMSFSKEILNKI